MSFINYACILAIVFLNVSSNPVEESESGLERIKQSENNPKGFNFVCSKVVEDVNGNGTRCEDKLSENQKKISNMNKKIKKKKLYSSEVEKNAERKTVKGLMVQKIKKVKSSQNLTNGQEQYGIINSEIKNASLHNRLIKGFIKKKGFITEFYKDNFKRSTLKDISNKIEKKHIERVKREVGAENETSSTKPPNTNSIFEINIPSSNLTEDSSSSNREESSSPSEEMEKVENPTKLLSIPTQLPPIAFRAIPTNYNIKRKMRKEDKKAEEEARKKDKRSMNCFRADLNKRKRKPRK